VTRTDEWIEAQLDNKIQFVYEIAFAKRELTGLDTDCAELKDKTKVKLEDTIRFEIKTPFDQADLLRRLAHFKSIGGRETEYSRMVARNQKGSDNQFLTHWYYPYKGKYHPRLVRSIFNIIHLQYGQTVLDPFVGSGTTTLEAHLFGLNSIGFDISPVCEIISKVKVTAGEVADRFPLYLKKAIQAMKTDCATANSKLSKDAKLLDYTEENTYPKFLKGIKDERIKNFYKLAQLIFASDRGRRGRDFTAFEKNLNVMIASALDLARTEKEIRSDRPIGTTRIEICDAKNLELKDKTVDGIITSPPYSIALNYMDNDRYALEELGIDIHELSEKCVGVKGKGEMKCRLYEKDMEKGYSEMYRVLKNGKYAVVVIGEAKVDGESTKTVDHAIEYCKSIGFDLRDNLPKKIFGLYNTIKDERVLFLQKNSR
jgi:tRNA G10  N-methylase Trm11